MSIIKQENELKGVPDDRLVSEMQNPTGMFPPYLVFTEINRREELRGRFAEEQSQMPTTSMAEEAVAQMMNGGLPPQQSMEQGLGQGMPQDMQGMQGMPPGMDQGMPPGMPPGMDQGMPPMPPGMDQGIASGPPMQMMSNGGMVRGFANGALVSRYPWIKGYEDLGVPDEVLESLDIADRSNPGSAASYLGGISKQRTTGSPQFKSQLEEAVRDRTRGLDTGTTFGLFPSERSSKIEELRPLIRESLYSGEELPLTTASDETSTSAPSAKSGTKSTVQAGTTTGISDPAFSARDNLIGLPYVKMDKAPVKRGPFVQAPAFVTGTAPELETTNPNLAFELGKLRDLYDASVMTEEELEEDVSKRMDKYRESNAGPDKNSMIAQQMMQMGSGLLGNATFAGGLSQGFSDMAKTAGVYSQDRNAYNKDMSAAEQAIYETSLARQQRMSDRQFQGRSALVDMSQRINQGAMDRNARLQSDYLSSEDANRRAYEANEQANRRAYESTVADDARAARSDISREQIAENQFKAANARALLTADTRSNDVRMRQDYDRLEFVREALIDPLNSMDADKKKKLEREFAILQRRLAGSEDRLERPFPGVGG